jgi:hypothetical protein
MVLQERSALPIENLRGEPCSGSAFRARGRAAKKFIRRVDFPQHHSTYR